MVLLTERWSVSVWLSRRTKNIHMRFLEGLILLKLLGELTVLRHSKTSKLSSEHGLCLGRASVMVTSLKQALHRFNTQPFLTLETPNCQFHPTFLKLFRRSGKKTSQRSSAQITWLSVTSTRHVRTLLIASSQLVFSWVIISLKSCQRNTCLGLAKTNVFLLFIVMSWLKSTKTTFTWATRSSSISSQRTTLTRMR